MFWSHVVQHHCYGTSRFSRCLFFWLQVRQRMSRRIRGYGSSLETSQMPQSAKSWLMRPRRPRRPRQHAEKDDGQWELHVWCVLFSTYVYNYVIQRERERERERGREGGREEGRERAQVHAKMDTHLTFAHICTYLHISAHICTYLHIFAHICTMFGSGVS